VKIYEAVADAMAIEAEGYIFGVLGDANMMFWSALCDNNNVQVISARHEASAVLMAQGMVETTGGVGVATVTCGPGLTHAATSIVSAARARAPIVIVTGDAPPGDRNAIQHLDQRRFAAACDAEFRYAGHPETLAEDIREAFYLARIKNRPVILSLPMGLLDQELQWEWNYQPSKSYIFQASLLPADQIINHLADLLAQSERPVIVAGRGAISARVAIERLGDQVGALLATSLLAKGLFDGHPYNAGISGTFSSAPTERLLAEADFVLGVGTSLGFFTSEGGLLFPSAEIARIDISRAPREIGILPGLYVQGDAVRTLGAISLALERNKVRKIGYRSAETLSILNQVDEIEDPARDGLDPRILMMSLTEALPENSHIVCGGGHFWAFPVMYLALPNGGRMTLTCHFGSIGQGLGVGIGASFSHKERMTIVIEGDGGLLQSLQEIQTIVENNLPLVILVMNDSAFGAEVHKMQAKKLNISSARWHSPDFVGIARSFGCDALKLDNETEIAVAIATSWNRKSPLLIDARISPTTMSDPYKKLLYAQDNRAPLPRRRGS
jgi:thiamine pyrophosphate-dependent acetolactate synthase large subunit-like protein